MITPLQVFEHQYQRRLGAQHVEGVGELTEHAGRRRPLDLTLQALPLRLAQQPWQLDQPQRGILPQHGQHLLVTRPTAELPQRLQDGPVRFSRPIVLDALAPCQPHPTPGTQAGLPQLDHGRLAHPGLTTDKDDLAGTVGGPLEPPLQGLDFVLAPYDGARSVSRHRRETLPVFPPEKPIALPSDRFKLPRRGGRITQRGANLLHTHPQHGIADMRPRPHMLPQLGLGDQAPGMLDQIPQHRQ